MAKVYYQLDEINRRVTTDPEAYIAECDAVYDQKLEAAADAILNNLKNSRIVLLSGPSGSGKTTTAIKLSRALTARGVKSYHVALDDYYGVLDVEDMPRTPEGDPDLESPLLLDMDLLCDHFTQLELGEKIYIPKYEFSRHMRIFEPSRSLRLGSDEIAIFEGIHALNDSIAGHHPEAFKLYVSARGNIADGKKTVFKGTWMRLLRRTVRDKLFRGADPAYTLSLWANVRRGEEKYIAPFVDDANLSLDTVLPYEINVLAP